jgi:hypothetical protein
MGCANASWTATPSAAPHPSKAPEGGALQNLAA